MTPQPSAPRLFLAGWETPIGGIRIVFDGEGRLRALDWEDHAARMHRLLRLHYGPAVELQPCASAPVPIRRALDAYFAGEHRGLDAIRVETGGTAFQRTVWAALRGIAPGAVTSYGALAARLGRLGAAPGRPRGRADLGRLRIARR